MLVLIGLIPLHQMVYLYAGWVKYRTPATGQLGNDKVAVIVPVYNQRDIIERVIDSIFASTYKNLEVIVVNDGSKDGTTQVLDRLKKEKYGNKIELIHQENAGKRKAVAQAFQKMTANYVVLIDSDSMIHREAIAELMKAFNGNPKVGALVGNAKVWNADVNYLTKCQSVWYDFSFNIRKCAESAFSTVLCCSGCLAAYRREAIEQFIPFWVNAPLKDSEDRELTTFAISTAWMKMWYLNRSKKLRQHMAGYDDSDDRALTAESLKEWGAQYVATATVFTDVPTNMGKFLKQQRRWKKGTMRVNAFVSMFIWRKNPIISILIFYIDFLMTFLAPILMLISLAYLPLISHNLAAMGTFFIGGFLVSLVHGLDWKFREGQQAKYWYYKPLMNLITGFIVSMLWVPALLQMRKNQWGTR